VLLVHADEAEARDGREDRRARTDHDRRCARGDALALVATLGLRERGVEHGDALAEAGAKAAERLRGEGDLRHEDDRPAAAREGRLAGAQVDLGLPAPRRAVQQEAAAAPVERALDACEGARLGVAERGGRFLPGQILLPLAPPRSGAPRRLVRGDERERPRRRRAIVLAEPEGEVDERCRDGAEDAVHGDGIDVGRRLVLEADDDPAALRTTEAHGDDRPLLEAVGEVGEGARDRARGDQRHH
jgi:hypothetical protein